MPESLLQIGELARLAKISIDTVRYYERRKLLPAAPRSAGSYRLFSFDTVAQVEFIKQGQELGFSLDEISGLLAAGGAENVGASANCLERSSRKTPTKHAKRKAS